MAERFGTRKRRKPRRTTKESGGECDKRRPEANGIQKRRKAMGIQKRRKAMMYSGKIETQSPSAAKASKCEGFLVDYPPDLKCGKKKAQRTVEDLRWAIYSASGKLLQKDGKTVTSTVCYILNGEDVAGRMCPYLAVVYEPGLWRRELEGREPVWRKVAELWGPSAQ